MSRESVGENSDRSNKNTKQGKQPKFGIFLISIQQYSYPSQCLRLSPNDNLPEGQL